MNDIQKAIDEYNRALKALALELPEAVYKDVKERLKLKPLLEQVANIEAIDLVLKHHGEVKNYKGVELKKTHPFIKLKNHRDKITNLTFNED